MYLIHLETEMSRVGEGGFRPACISMTPGSFRALAGKAPAPLLFPTPIPAR